MKIEKLSDKIAILRRRRERLEDNLANSDNRRGAYWDRSEHAALEAAIALLEAHQANRDGNIDQHLTDLMAGGRIDHPVEVVRMIVEAYSGPDTPEGKREHFRAIEKGRRLIASYDGPG